MSVRDMRFRGGSQGGWEGERLQTSSEYKNNAYICR